MANNLFNRYVWLVDTIHRNGRITFDEINEKWIRSRLNDSGEEMPLRTFHNHRKAIEEVFDINIECDKRNGYVYYIEDSINADSGSVSSWLLNMFTVKNLINESHKLKDRILFEDIPSGQQFLAPILEAMNDEVVIEMTYQSFWHNEPTAFTVEPYCLKAFRQRWYLVGFSPYYDKIMIYALDRIKQVDPTETKFKIATDFNPQEYFYNYFGIIADEDVKTEEVVIKALGIRVRYLQALPLHHSQQETETTDDYSIFTYHIKPTYDFRQELLSYGGEIEILSPQWFRDEFKAIAKIYVDRYYIR